MIELLWIVFSAILAWFAHYPLVGYLMFAMFMDFLTGVTAAMIEKKLNSSIGTKGWVVKSAVLLGVCFAIGMEPLIIEKIGNFPVASLITLGFIAVEGISVIENLGRSGVTMPTWFTGMFVKLQDKDAAKDRAELDREIAMRQALTDRAIVEKQAAQDREVVAKQAQSDRELAAAVVDREVATKVTIKVE